jgi:hypothetical protein
MPGSSSLVRVVSAPMLRAMSAGGGEIALRELAVDADPGVVDQDGDRDVAADELLDQLAARIAPAEVLGDGDDRHADLHAELERLGIEPGSIARDQHQLVARLGELPRQGEADPARTAGDQRGAADGIRIHASPPCCRPVERLRCAVQAMA